MNKYVIYPFDKTIIPLVRFFDKLVDDGKLNSVVSPIGLGLGGKDVGFADNRDDIGIIVKEDIFEEIDNADILLYVPTFIHNNMSSTAIDIMEYALQNNKKVVCCQKLTTSELDKLKTYEKFEYKVSNEEFDGLGVVLNRNLQIATPVLMVAGLYENTNNYEVYLDLCSKFKSDGYKILGIGEDICSKFLGIHSLDDSFNETTYNEYIVFHINNFIKKLELLETPDIIILQLPKALMRYNDLFTNGMGIVPYFYSQAIKPDVVVCCDSYKAINHSVYEDLSETMYHRFGYNIDLIHMSNKEFITFESMALGDEVYNNHKLEKSDLFVESKIPIFHMLNDEISQKAYEYILSLF